MVLAERIGKNGALELKEFGKVQWRILPTSDDGTKDGWRQVNRESVSQPIQSVMSAPIPPEVVNMTKKGKVGRPVSSNDPKNIRRRKSSKNSDSLAETIVKQLNDTENGN